MMWSYLLARLDRATAGWFGRVVAVLFGGGGCGRAAAPAGGGPASATGREFSVLMTTWLGLLFVVPSLTMSWATYVPGRSISRSGNAPVGSDSTATLPAGTVVNDQK